MVLLRLPGIHFILGFLAGLPVTERHLSRSKIVQTALYQKSQAGSMLSERIQPLTWET